MPANRGSLPPQELLHHRRWRREARPSGPYEALALGSVAAAAFPELVPSPPASAGHGATKVPCAEYPLRDGHRGAVRMASECANEASEAPGSSRVASWGHPCDQRGPRASPSPVPNLGTGPSGPWEPCTRNGCELLTNPYKGPRLVPRDSIWSEHLSPSSARGHPGGGNTVRPITPDRYTTGRLAVWRRPELA